MALLGILMTGCGQGNSKPVLPTKVNLPATFTKSTSATPISSPPVRPGTPEAASDVLQSNIPLKVTDPADAADIKTDTVTVKGQTVPGATVSVNDIVGTADAGGNFSVTISLDQGPNAIDVIATDESGKEGEVLIIVNVIS